jgi:hypothetical protein
MSLLIYHPKKYPCFTLTDKILAFLSPAVRRDRNGLLQVILPGWLLLDILQQPPDRIRPNPQVLLPSWRWLYRPSIQRPQGMSLRRARMRYTFLHPQLPSSYHPPFRRYRQVYEAYTPVLCPTPTWDGASRLPPDQAGPLMM